MLLYAFEFGGLFLGTLCVLLTKVHQNQPKPYMDEIFHIPQTQAYCSGRFDEWDPKITTFPGLYVFSTMLLHCVSWLSGIPVTGLCSTLPLRMINCLLAMVNFCLFFLIAKRSYLVREEIHSTIASLSSSTRCAFLALQLSLFPLLFFFAFLFYTEQVSTALVLATFYSYTRGSGLWCTVFAALALFARQTNIVWLLFICGCVWLDQLGTCAAARVQQNAVVPPSERTRSRLVHMQPSSAGTERSKEIPTPSVSAKEMLMDDVVLAHALAKWDILFLAKTTLRAVLQCSGLILVGVLFAAFIHQNGGVVVGDKTAHFVQLHLCQLFYFALFTCALTPSRSLLTAFRLIQEARAAPWRNGLTFVIGCSVVVLAIRFSTVEHPYLLADNRHLVFYIWARGFRVFWWQKYVYAPLYVLALKVIWTSWNPTWSPIRRSFFFVCTALCLVTAPLLEFRYFLLPFLLYRLHAVERCRRLHLIVETLLCVAVNAAVFYLFLYRTFSWPSEPGVVQRFMW